MRSESTEKLIPKILKTPVQFKLSVGAPDDPLEDEADAMADKVMRMPEQSFIQRKCAHCEEEEKVQRKPLAPFIQKKSIAGNNIAGDSISSQVQSTKGNGNPMPAVTKTFMESRFGTDFSNVRIHTGDNASQLSNQLNAQAFTVGNDIYFNAGKFSPESSNGKHLLAHELTHTVQQNNNAINTKLIQRKVNAIRFQEDAVLTDISDGKKVLKEKDKLPAVIKITQALSELGFYTNPIIDESFDPPLTSGIVSYQAAKTLTGKAQSGKVDKPTFDELDKDFSGGYGVERNVLGKQKKADILKGTDAIDTVERTQIEKEISTEVPVNPVTGLPPVFKPDIPLVGKYKDRLRAAVDKEIVDEYNSMGKNKGAAHADPSKIYSWTQVDIIATESQKATDKVFGEYKKGAAMKGTVNIFDAWADKVKKLTAGGKAAEDAAADWRVRKILTGDKVIKAIDRQHGAIQSRAAEKAIVDKIKTDMIAKYRTELLETHKGWPGYEQDNKVFIQLFKETTNDANRRNMWDYFQTFIHEYIHSLEDPAHITYREAKDEQKGGFVLREGVTDYFTKVVWSSVSITDALRKTIEGPFHDPVNKFAIQGLNTYDESENAERLAGVVGIRNLAAAFFLGKIELIGKK